MKNPKSTITAILAILATAGPAGAIVTALDGPWYTGSAPATAGTPSISDPNSDSFVWGSGTESGGSSARRGMLWTYFTPQTLANDGDSIVMSFTAQWPTTAAASSGSMRFGIFDSNGSMVTTNLANSNTDAGFDDSLGYYAGVGLGNDGSGSDGNLQLRARTTGGVNPLSTIDTGSYEDLINSPSDPNATAANTPFFFSLAVTRNSATEYALDLAAGSATTDVTTTTIPASSFDTFFLLNTPQSDLDSITFSNFQIDYQPVPEPSMVLLALGAMLLPLRRRR